MSSSKGKRIILGTDVIRETGASCLKELQDSYEELNEVCFNLNELEKEEMDSNVRGFLREVNKFREENYDNLKISSTIPDNNQDSSTIFLTDDPITHTRMYERGYNVEEPRFLLHDPEIFKKGINRGQSKDQFKQLKEGYSLEDAIDRFSLGKTFINQFVMVDTPEGLQALYQIKQDWKLEDESQGPEMTSDPYLQRIRGDLQYFENKDNPLLKKELDFGVVPNHLNQYLAYHHLLNSPDIELVALSGEAGSGKTLLAYMAAMRQTLIETGDEKSIKKSSKNSLYDCIRLIKAAVGVDKTYELGHLPGDINEKERPASGSYAHVHEELGFGFSFDDALSANNYQFYRARANGGTGFYPPSQSHPLLYQEPIQYIQGKTFKGSFIILDESQDAASNVTKSILTRVGTGSKIVMCGDPYQVSPNRGLSPEKNGFVHSVAEHAKMTHPYFGMINLPESSRGNVARKSNLIPNRRY